MQPYVHHNEYFKRLDNWLMTPDFKRQVTELYVCVLIFNRFTQLSTSETVRLAYLRLG